MEPDLMGTSMIEYLKRKILSGKSVEIGLDTPLVTSGLVDSFALIDVLFELEKITARRIPASRVSPKDLNTVREMLNTAERLGTKK
jgi:acyl carrier protein